MTATKKNLNKELLALFSGHANMVTTPKLYIELTGHHIKGLILNQCVFWSNKSNASDGFFYKSYQEWFDETHIPERSLRRYLKIMECNDWITLKVKKVNNKNTLHIKTHIDKIFESISTMLDQECPNRPSWPNGADNAHNTCIKSVPTGQTGRSEPAKLAGSIYTDDYVQINKKTTTTAVKAEPARSQEETSSSSFFFSETLDNEISQQKLSRDPRSPEAFLKEVKKHVDDHSDKSFPYLQRAQAALKLVKKLKEQNSIFFVRGNNPEDKNYNPLKGLSRKEIIERAMAENKAQHEGRKYR